MCAYVHVHLYVCMFMDACLNACVCVDVCMCSSTNIVSEQAAFSGFSSLLPLSSNFGSSLGSTPG